MTTLAPSSQMALTDLVDPIRAVDEKLSQRVETTASLLAELSQSADLQLGLAGQPQRKPAATAAEIRPLLPDDVELGVSLLKRDELPLGGRDAWFLVVQADQLGSLTEKEFIAQLGGAVANHCVILVTNHARIDANEVDKVLSYAVDTFAALGVPEDNVFFFPTDEGESQLKTCINSWLAQRETLRAKSIKALTDPLEAGLVEHETNLTDFLEKTPDIDIVRAQHDGIARSQDWMDSMLADAVDDITGALSEAYAEAFHEKLSSLGSEPLTRQSIDHLLECQQHWLANELPYRLQELLERRLDSFRPNLDQLEPVVDRVIEQRPWDAVKRPIQILESNLDLPNTEESRRYKLALRIISPVAGATAGLLLIRSIPGAIVGAAVSAAGVEAGMRLADPERRINWQDVARQQLGQAPELNIRNYVDSAISETRTCIQEASLPVLQEANSRVVRAETAAEERKVAQQKLKTLGHLHDALNSIRQ